MNKILNAIRSVVCLILCLILFLVMLIYLFLNLTPKIVNKDNVATLVSSLEIKDILGDDGLSIIEPLYEVAEENNIDKTIVDGLLNSKEIKEVFGIHFGNLVDTLLYNGTVKQITVNELVNAVEQVLDRNVSDLGYTLTSKQKTIILETVEEKAIDLVDVIPTYEELTKELNDKNRETLHFVFGGGLANILLIVIIIIVAGIIICRWSTYRFAIWTGITTSIVGLFFVVIGEMLNSLLPQVLSEIYSINIIGMLQNDIIGIITKTGVTVLLIGALQIIYYFILRKTKEYKKLY